jgi:hypothetical protein
MLSASSKSYLQEVPYEITSPVNISGNTYEIVLSLPASKIDKAFIVRKDTIPCNQQQFEQCYDCYSDYNSEITLTQVSPTVYRFENAFNDDWYYFIVKYQVDSENVSITSLNRLLRDLVCYNLSSRIYSNQDGKLAPITQYYMKQVESAERMLPNWIPNEFSKIKLFFKKTPFQTYKISRS